jgi:hypothetical protein
MLGYFYAFSRIMKQFMKQLVSCYHLIIAPRVAHPNQAMFLLRELEYEFMHMDAS